MRFEPDDLAPLFEERGLSTETQPGRALWRRLVHEEEKFEIAAALGVSEKKAGEYLCKAWVQFIPEGEQERRRWQIRLLQAVILTIDAGREIELEEPVLTERELWLFILRETGALRILSGSQSRDWNRRGLFEEWSLSGRS
jgi:hypothetical protein